MKIKMREMKAFAMMLGCLAAMSFTFTSCSDDDDSYRPLTPEETKTAFEAVKGEKTGKLVYVAKDEKGKAKNDTLDIAWNINTDSTMTIKNFPVKVLVENITDSAMRVNLMKQPNTDLQCQIEFTRTSPVTFLIAPATQTYQLSYDDKTPKVEIAFNGNLASYGTYTTNTGMTIWLAENAVSVDGKQSTVLPTPVLFKIITVTK